MSQITAPSRDFGEASSGQSDAAVTVIVARIAPNRKAVKQKSRCPLYILRHLIAPFRSF
jgi:hypothetical protein